MIHTRNKVSTGVFADFIVIDHICDRTPRKPLENGIQNHPELDNLADPTFHMPNDVLALIGAGTYAQLILEGMTRIDEECVAQQTELGQVVFGNTQYAPNAYCNITTELSNNELDEALRKLWEIDHNIEGTDLSPEDRWVQENFVRTHYRDPDGRYVVTIPIKPNGVESLGESRAIAERQFRWMEKQRMQNGIVREKYVQFMREYEALGHMREAVDVPNDHGKKLYITHHALPAERKFRVVFNASQKTSKGTTFNSIQYAGPRLQQDLHELVTRFRRHRVAVTADIVKMFRQVRIVPEQYDLQRILWRENPNEPIKEYQMTVITYGMTASAYNAVRAMQQCGEDHRIQYPKAYDAISKGFYMDDYVDSFNSIGEAIDTRQEVEASLDHGGFTLAKWA